MENLKTWSSVLGHTCGLVTPNLSWFKVLHTGNVVEIWKNVETSGWSAHLVSPAPGYKPGQLYVVGVSLGHLNFSRWSQLVATGWL